MKRLLLPLLLILTLTASTAQGGKTHGQAQVEKSYDRFKDTTTITLKPQRVLQIASPREELDISAEAIRKGQTSEAPEEVHLIFNSVGEKWHYYDKADVIFIVDGKRMEAGTAYVLEGIPGPPLVKETLKLALPLKTFLQIANGKDVALNLGPTQLRLAEKDLLALRAFASYLTN